MHLRKPSDEQILQLVEAMLDESDMIEQFDSLLSDPASRTELEAEGRALFDKQEAELKRSCTTPEY